MAVATASVKRLFPYEYIEIEERQRLRRRKIHQELLDPSFGPLMIKSFIELVHLCGPPITHFFHLPFSSAALGKIILYSPTCIVSNIHLAHKKKDAESIHSLTSSFVTEGRGCVLPSFASEESDCTLYIVPSSDLSVQLFEQMPQVIEELDRLVKEVNSPKIFSKTFVCWNKKRCEQMVVYDGRNIENYKVHLPIPRRLFVPPPEAIMRVVNDSLFAGRPLPPPLLHWSVYSMKEGKLFGLNFDWHECYLTPTSLDDDEGGDEDGTAASEEEQNEEPSIQAQEFRKLSDSKYAVVLMMSNYRRVIKFYFHPSLVPATADPTRKKRICSTIRFELNNGQFLVIPQETKVCVTASQVSNEIFSGKKQKKDFAKTFYFCVLFFGPRFINTPAPA